MGKSRKSVESLKRCQPLKLIKSSGAVDISPSEAPEIMKIHLKGIDSEDIFLGIVGTGVENFGIFQGDTLVLIKNSALKKGDLIAKRSGEVVTVERFPGTFPQLVCSNGRKLARDADAGEIIGKVTHVIHEA